MIKSVGFITGLDNTRKAVNCHVHQAKLSVILHLFLSVKGHGTVGVHALGIDKITALNEHTARTAGRVKQNSAFRLQNIDDHFYKRLRREKHTVIGRDILCKLIEEVFVNSADNVAADIIQCAVVKNAQQLCQQLVRKIGIAFRQHTCKLFALILYQLHRIVDDFAEAIHLVSVTAFQIRCRDIFGEIHKVIILCFLGKIQCALCRKITCLHRQHPTSA